MELCVGVGILRGKRGVKTELVEDTFAEREGGTNHISIPVRS